MRKQWAVGFIVAAAILVIVGFWITPLGAILGGLILFSATTIGVVSSNVVFVRERTALVVCSRLHDAVLRVVPGPDRTFLTPFVERAGPMIDTSYRMEHVYVDNVLQSSGRPTTLGFTAYVKHQLEPYTVLPAQLGKILPHLTNNLSGILQHYTSYCLRNLIADLDFTRMDNDRRQRLERHLTEALRGQLAALGITIQGVQLLIRPPVGLHNTLTEAEQRRVGITLQAEQLNTILHILTHQSEEAHSLALLELARSLGRDGHTWTAVDLASLMGAELGDTPAAVQLPLWLGPQQAVAHEQGRHQLHLQGGR